MSSFSKVRFSLPALRWYQSLLANSWWQPTYGNSLTDFRSCKLYSIDRNKIFCQHVIHVCSRMTRCDIISEHLEHIGIVWDEVPGYCQYNPPPSSSFRLILSERLHFFKISTNSWIPGYKTSNFFGRFAPTDFRCFALNNTHKPDFFGRFAPKSPKI